MSLTSFSRHFATGNHFRVFGAKPAFKFYAFSRCLRRYFFQEKALFSFSHEKNCAFNSSHKLSHPNNGVQPTDSTFLTPCYVKFYRRRPSKRSTAWITEWANIYQEHRHKLKQPQFCLFEHKKSEEEKRNRLRLALCVAE